MKIISRTAYGAACMAAGAVVMLASGAGAATTTPAALSPAALAGAVHVKCKVPGNSSPVPALRFTVGRQESLTKWSAYRGFTNGEVVYATLLCGNGGYGGWPLPDLRFLNAFDRGQLTVYPGTVLYVLQIDG